MMWAILVEDGAVGKDPSLFFPLSGGRRQEKRVDRESVGLEVDDSLHFTCIH